VPITLVNASSPSLPLYGIDNSTLSTNIQTDVDPPFEAAYFIRGSELKLYDEDGYLDYSEILYIGHDFTYELGTWYAKPYLGRSTGTPNGKDLQRAMDLFLRAPQNPEAQGGATRQGVHDAMVAYMEAFIEWRDNNYLGEGCPGPVANNGYSSAVGAARTALSTVSNNLINP
jgi:hypothetical protein